MARREGVRSRPASKDVVRTNIIMSGSTYRRLSKIGSRLNWSAVCESALLEAVEPGSLVNELAQLKDRVNTLEAEVKSLRTKLANIAAACLDDAMKVRRV
jgi:cell division protein FtsB